MKFKVHQISGYLCDIYLVEYHKKLLLLDSGSSSDFKIIYDYITVKLQRSILDLKLIIVTHIHPDHSGTAEIFSKKFNIPISAFNSINLWYSCISGFIQHKFDRIMANYNARKLGLQYERFDFPRRLNLSYIVSHNQPLPFFEDWIAYHVPGHTNHDIVLFNKEEQMLYCSDCVVKVRKNFFTPFPVTNAALMRKSLIFLKELKCNSYFLAHGGIIHNDKNETNIFEEAISNLCRPMARPLNLFYPFFFITWQANYKRSCKRAKLRK